MLKRPPVSIYKMCQLKAEWLKHPWISAKPLLTAWLFFMPACEENGKLFDLGKVSFPVRANTELMDFSTWMLRGFDFPPFEAFGGNCF